VKPSVTAPGVTPTLVMPLEQSTWICYLS